MTHPLDWQTRAACMGMDLNRFFPEMGFLVEDDVLQTCARCPVLAECRDWAIGHDEFGVWGGLDEDKRRKVNVTRSRVRCPDCRSDQVAEQGGSEVCLSCGLSWPV